MYPEYDPNEPSLGQAFANMLRGFQDPKQWQEVGQGIQNTAQVVPNVAESLVRGGVGQAIGTMGDLRDLRNTVQSYMPQSLQNWSNAAEFLTNPYAKALIETAPTTEKVLETVPRVTPAYEGSGQHEVLGEFIAPSLGYFGGKMLGAGKNLPIGLSIEDVTPPTKVAEALRQPEKNALGFYSPLDEAVLALKNEKGTGQQYLAQLLKTGGVKPEEVSTRGLDTFLGENPKVTKEQLVNYLRENPVELRETVIGGNTKRNLDSTPYSEYYLGEGQALDDPDYVSMRADDIYAEEYKNDQDLIQELRDNIVHENPEKYADWEVNPSINERLEKHVDSELYKMAEDRAQLEYDDNPVMEHTDDLGYRVTGNDDFGYQVIDPQGNLINYRKNGEFSLSEAEDAIREHALDNGLLHYDEDEFGTKYHDYTLPNGENYREVLVQYEPKRSAPNYEIKALPEEDQTFGKYYGVYEGDKLINSWHGKTNAEDWVAGQKANYKDYGNYESGHFDEPNILAHFRTTDRTIDGKKTLFVEEIQSDWHQSGRKKGYKTPVDFESKIRPLSDADKEIVGTDEGVMMLNDKGVWGYMPTREQAMDYLVKKEGYKVPDAPFKKNWQELAMKRAMQMAAEGGYDRVAFTTGKQQADRYSLSKQVNDLTITRGTHDFTINATDKNGRPAILKTIPDLRNLDDYVGKDLANKIKEDFANKSGQEHTYSGLDLDVGGEGMKGFYDKILPDFVNKYGKKHGLKVGQTGLKGKTIPDNEKQFYEIGKKYGYTREQFDDLEPAERRKIFDKELDDEPVHYFDLTPEAKESFLKKGQPMFAAAPLGLTDEDTRRKVLEKLFNVNNK